MANSFNFDDLISRVTEGLKKSEVSIKVYTSDSLPEDLSGLFDEVLRPQAEKAEQGQQLDDRWVTVCKVYGLDPAAEPWKNLVDLGTQLDHYRDTLEKIGTLLEGRTKNRP